MKKILGIIIAFVFYIPVNGQELNFLNHSICGSEELKPHYEANEYVQGGGHNYYLSYPVEAHQGSYSEDEYSYGTDDNPMIIYLDSLGEKLVKKYYFSTNESDIYSGIDSDDMYISRGLWPEYTDQGDPFIGPDLNYENRVFRCLADEEGVSVRNNNENLNSGQGDNTRATDSDNGRF